VEEIVPPATDAAPAPPGPNDPLIGRTIKGRYRVVKLLGRGAMGNVYEVMHERLRSSFALKQLRADLESEPGIVSRFRHEAEVMARLSHPNVARVFDVDAEPGVGSWMAMELVHGADLGAHMRSVGRLPLGEAVRIGFQIATALDCAHRAGLVHRDIKPANVLLECGTGRAVLTDFGIAKSLVPGEADAATRTGVFLGTYRYSSPEQLRHQRGVEIDGRADVYSLGVVLFEMVSGKKFLAGFSESDVLHEVGFNPTWTPPLAYDDPQPPAALVALIAHCLAPRRDDRIASAGVVAQRLAEIATALPPASATVLVAPAASVETTAPTRLPSPAPAARHRARAGGIHSALRAKPAPRRGVGWWGAGVALVLLAAALLVTPAGERLRARVGFAPGHAWVEVQRAQPEDKVVQLTRSAPRWFSVVVEGADPEHPPPMRWYLNDVLVAENTTMWEYDPAKNLQDVTAHGQVRFVVGAGRLPHQTHVWATETTAKDLSPVLLSASYKPGSTITAAPGETIVIAVDAIDPDGDPLSYTWRLDGTRVGDNAPRLALDARRGGKITLTISDGGVFVSSSWTLAVATKRP
jgi:serine/threonine-protein kinase